MHGPASQLDHYTTTTDFGVFDAVPPSPQITTPIYLWVIYWPTILNLNHIWLSIV